MRATLARFLCAARGPKLDGLDCQHNNRHAGFIAQRCLRSGGPGRPDFIENGKREALGTISFSSSNRFPPNSALTLVNQVTFPPGGASYRWARRILCTDTFFNLWQLRSARPGALFSVPGIQPHHAPVYSCSSGFAQTSHLSIVDQYAASALAGVRFRKFARSLDHRVILAIG